MVAFGGRKGVTAVAHRSVDEVSGAVQPGVQAALRLADQELNFGACRQKSQPGTAGLRVRESRQGHCVRKTGRDRHLVPIPLWRSPDQRRCPGKDGVSGYSHGNRIPLPETHTSWTMSSMSRSTLHMDTLKVDSRPASVIFPVSLGCPPPCGWKMVEDSSKKAGSKETLVIVALCANLRRRRPRSQERASEIVLE